MFCLFFCRCLCNDEQEWFRLITKLGQIELFSTCLGPNRTFNFCFSKWIEVDQKWVIWIVKWNKTKWIETNNLTWYASKSRITYQLQYYIILDKKIIYLFGSPNRIVKDSKFDSKEFRHGLYNDSDFKVEIESYHIILIYFWSNLIYLIEFDLFSIRRWKRSL